MQRLQDHSAALRLVQTNGLTDGVLQTLMFLFTGRESLLLDALSLVDAAAEVALAAAAGVADAQHRDGVKTPAARGGGGGGGGGGGIGGGAAAGHSGPHEPPRWRVAGGATTGGRTAPGDWHGAPAAKLVQVVFQPSGRTVFRVQGRNQRHICFRDYCSCKQFAHNIQARYFWPCRHLLASALAQALSDHQASVAATQSSPPPPPSSSSAAAGSPDHAPDPMGGGGGSSGGDTQALPSVFFTTVVKQDCEFGEILS